MPILSLKLKAKTSKVEDDAALRLMAAALTNDQQRIKTGFKNASVKRLLKRGVLRVDQDE